MIDIIEAGKFYNECLKKVHESILKDSILPENEVFNVKAQLVDRPGKYDRAVVGAFKLNNKEYTFDVSVDKGSTPQDIFYEVRNHISYLIAESIANSISLDL